MSPSPVDFYIDFSSPYSYIASEWIEALAARHGGLPWDCVLSAELFRAYKPSPAVYRGAADLLGIAPGELLMVAAHPSDLAAAQRAGLKTAYVERPLERGPGGAPENSAGQRFDWVASDFIDLAAKLGA